MRERIAEGAIGGGRSGAAGDARIHIVGAGFAGLSAAISLAERGNSCSLFSVQPSERAQSVLAEGGINAALDTMGEGDTPAEHFADTMRGGADLADPDMVRGLTESAPEIVRWLRSLGVPFQETAEGELALRSFGGQKKKRTAYVRSSTGKAMMTALIDEARRYEAAGLIRRYPHHTVLGFLWERPGRSAPEGAAGTSPDGSVRPERAAHPAESAVCYGIRVRDDFTGAQECFRGSVILACGGLNGLFAERTTGTVSNTGDLCAAFYALGGELGNLEFVQYHPTTVPIPGKRLLISEAARGEGGRLFVERGGKRWYFLEELYPELGNLMPRDVVSREIVRAAAREDCGDTVYLDMTELPAQIWGEAGGRNPGRRRSGAKAAGGRLSDLREELIRFLGVDPAAEPVAVSPGIHFFMGGILVDARHRTSVPGIYAAGECACAYHGANRLGANSMLAALYGGRIAAESAARELGELCEEEAENDAGGVENDDGVTILSAEFEKRLSEILWGALGIFREEQELERAAGEIRQLLAGARSEAERRRALLGEAMLLSALERRESRGAHTRTDCPERDDAAFQGTTVARLRGGRTEITFRAVPGRRAEE